MTFASKKNLFNNLGKGILQVNWGHPITKKLLFLTVHNSPTGATYAVYPKIKTETAGVPVRTKGGIASRDWTFSDGDTRKLDWTSGPFSAFAYFYVNAIPTSGQFPGIFVRSRYTGESDNQGWEIALSGASTKYRFNVNNNNGFAFYQLATSTSITIGNHKLLGTSDGTTRSLYLDVKECVKTTNNPVPITPSTAVSTKNVTSTASNPTYITAAWKRCLTANENRLLNINPYILVYNPNRVSFFFSESSGSGNASYNHIPTQFRIDLIVGNITASTTETRGAFPSLSSITVSVLSPTVSSSANSFVSPSISSVTVLINSPTTISSISSIASPALTSITILVNTSTASTNTSTSSNATPSLTSVTVLINTATATTNQSSSSSASPSLSSATIIVNSPTLNTSRSVEILPGLNVVTISAGSSTARTTQSRIATPAVSNASVTIFTATIPTASTTSGIAKKILLRSGVLVDSPRKIYVKSGIGRQ